MPEDAVRRPDDGSTAGDGRTDERTGRGAAAARMQQQARWVDLQIEQAMARGEFDDLPGAGKPLQGLGSEHDPDWWLRNLVEREQITGVLPPALQLRKEDAEFEADLDRLASAAEVRREVEAFNERVRVARMQLNGGPPVVTPMREVDDAVAAWEARRRARVEAHRAARAAAAEAEVPRRRWWLGRRGRPRTS